MPGGTGGAGVPTASDNAIFDSGSNNYDCVMTADLVCNSLIAEPTWLRNFDDGGFNLTSNHDIFFDGAGNLTYNGKFTILYEGTFRIDVTVGIVTTSLTTALDLQGNDTWDIRKADVDFGVVDVAYPNKSVFYTADSLSAIHTPSVLNNLTVRGGVFNQAAVITYYSLSAVPGSTLIFKAGSTYTLVTYLSGDLDGTAQNPISFISDSFGIQFTLDNPVGMELLYVTATDSIAVNNIIAYNSTLTNDINWNNILSCSSSSSSSSSSSFSSCSSSFSSSSSSSSSLSSCSCSSSSSSFSSSSCSSCSCSSCSCSSSFSSSSSCSSSLSSCSSSFSSCSSSFSSSSSCSSSFSSCSSSFSSCSFSSCSRSSISYSSCSCSRSSSSSSHSSASSLAPLIFIINDYEKFFRNPIPNGVFKYADFDVMMRNWIDREDLVFWWEKKWLSDGTTIEGPVFGSQQDAFGSLLNLIEVLRLNTPNALPNDFTYGTAGYENLVYGSNNEWSVDLKEKDTVLLELAHTNASGSISNVIRYSAGTYRWRAVVVDWDATAPLQLIYIINDYEAFFTSPLTKGVYKYVGTNLLLTNQIDRTDLIFWWEKRWLDDGSTAEAPVNGSQKDSFGSLKDLIKIVRDNAP